jgi:CRP/FNR family cyclic AMP-dependent transcriptional regulator
MFSVRSEIYTVSAFIRVSAYFLNGRPRITEATLDRTIRHSEAEMAALQQSSLFDVFPVEHLVNLLATAHRRSFQVGAPIYHSGDPGSTMMIVVSGHVRLSLPSGNGKATIIADVGPSQVFGEVSMFDGRGRYTDATARSNVVLLAFERSDLLEALNRFPEGYARLLAILCRKLRLAEERISEIGAAPLTARLAKAILRHHEEGKTAAHITVSQSDLAGLVSSSREAVNRQLAEWQKQGLIKVANGSIHLLEYAALFALAQQA